jgi:hypothetical protein
MSATCRGSSLHIRQGPLKNPLLRLGGRDEEPTPQNGLRLPYPARKVTSQRAIERNCFLLTRSSLTPDGHSGCSRGAQSGFACWKKSECQETGLESSSGAENTTKMHSKTSSTHLEGSRGPNSDPKNRIFSGGNRPPKSPPASTIARPP